MTTVQATCPSGYLPIPGDASNCKTSTSSTVVVKTCPTGYTLQRNGLCGTGNTYALSGPLYCGPQYTGKICRYMAQLVPGVTPQTGTESRANMICAFLEGDTQFPCDSGCCSGTGTGTTSGTGTVSDSALPAWVIILLIGLGTLFFAILLAFAAKKMSRNTR